MAVRIGAARLHRPCRSHAATIQFRRKSGIQQLKKLAADAPNPRGHISIGQMASPPQHLPANLPIPKHCLAGLAGGKEQTCHRYPFHPKRQRRELSCSLLGWSIVPLHLSNSACVGRKAPLSSCLNGARAVSAPTRSRPWVENVANSASVSPDLTLQD